METVSYYRLLQSLYSPDGQAFQSLTLVDGILLVSYSVQLLHSLPLEKMNYSDSDLPMQSASLCRLLHTLVLSDAKLFRACTDLTQIVSKPQQTAA